MKRKLLAGLIAFAFVFSPLLARAESSTPPDIEALRQQINMLLQQVAAMASQLAREKGETPPDVSNIPTFCHTFTKNLKISDNNTEVSALWTALLKEGLVEDVSGGLTVNDFDEKLASAVVAFQEKYASEILAPNKLTHGNGFVGVSTRAKLNRLYSCGKAGAIITTTPGTITPNTNVTNPSQVGINQPLLYAQSAEIVANQSTYAPGQPIKFGVRAWASNNSIAGPAMGFNVSAQLSKNGPKDVVIVNGVLQSVNAIYNPTTALWDVSMTMPTDPSPATYTVNVGFYCSNVNSTLCAQKQIDKTFTVTTSSSATQPSITVLSPNGGESWSVGNYYSVKWSSSNYTKGVEVFLEHKLSSGSYEDFGEVTAVGEATTGSPSTGSFSWQVPSSVYWTGRTIAVGNGVYRLKFGGVGATGFEPVSYSSDFTITSPTSATQPSISNITGASSFQTSNTGVTTYIKWNALSNVGNVKVEICYNNKSTCFTPPGGQSFGSSYQPFYWYSYASDPYVGKSDVYVKVTDLATGVSAYSPTAISVLATGAVPYLPPPQPSITVLSPNGGQSYKVGDQVQISISATNPNQAPVAIALSRVGQTQDVVGINPDLSGNTWTWTIPSTVTPGTDYVIRASIYGCVGTTSLTCNSIVSDTSNYAFTISAPASNPPPASTPAISSISPSTCAAGCQVNIYGSGFSTINSDNQVSFTKTSGSTGTVNITPVSSTANTLIITLPGTTSIFPGTYNVMVGNNAGFSNTRPFTVTSGIAVYSVSPTSAPAGTRVTVYGSGFTSDNSVQLVYSGGGSVNFNNIPSTNGTSLTFTVPNNTPGSYTVSVVNNSTNGSSGTVPFTIAPTPPPASPTISVTSLPSSQSWALGSTQTLTWTSTGGISYVNVDLYKNGAFDRNIASNVLNQGTQPWTVPTNLVSGVSYQIRVTSTASPSIYGMSQSYFYIPTTGSSGNVNSLVFTLTSVDQDKADGYAFSPGGGADWGYSATFNLNSAKTIASMQITSSSETWTTASAGNYLISVFDGGSQLSYAYGQTFALPAGSKTLTLYTQKWLQTFNQAYTLKVTFTDGSTLSAMVQPTNLATASSGSGSSGSGTALSSGGGSANTQAGSIPVTSSVSASVTGTGSDHAGIFGVFGPGKGNTNGQVSNDWEFTTILGLASDKTVKQIDINNGGERWSTSAANSAYPLVVFYNGAQVNTAYEQTAGTYPAGTYTLKLYGQKEGLTYNGGYILVTFTDGSTPVYSAIPSSSITSATSGKINQIANALQGIQIILEGMRKSLGN